MTAAVGLADLERGSGEVTTLRCECCFHGDGVVFIRRMTGVGLLSSSLDPLKCELS